MLPHYTEIPPFKNTLTSLSNRTAKLPVKCPLVDHYVGKKDWMNHEKDIPGKLLDSLPLAADYLKKPQNHFQKYLVLSNVVRLRKTTCNYKVCHIIYANNYSNLGQTLVVALDQPLYAISKIENIWSYGKNNLVLASWTTEMTFTSVL